MANQSVLRKKFPEDFFAQASTQLQMSTRHRGSPQPGGQLSAVTQSWMKVPSIRDIRSSSETRLGKEQSHSRQQDVRASVVCGESMALFPDDLLAQTRAQEANLQFPKRRKAVLPMRLNLSREKEIQPKTEEPMVPEVMLRNYEPKEPEPEQGEPLFMATFRLQNNPNFQKGQGIENRARSLERVSEIPMKPSQSDKEIVNGCGALKLPTGQSTMRGVNRSSIGCGEALSGTRYFRKLAISKDKLFKVRNPVTKVKTSSLTRKVRNAYHPDYSKMSCNWLGSPTQEGTKDKSQEMCVIGQTPNFKNCYYANGSQTAPSSNKQSSEEAPSQFVGDLGAFLKKNSFKVSHFIEQNFHSLKNSRKPTPIGTDCSATNQSSDLRRQLQQVSLFDQTRQHPQQANLIKMARISQKIVDDSFQSNASNTCLPHSSTLIPHIDLQSISTPPTNRIEIQPFESLNHGSFSQTGLLDFSVTSGRGSEKFSSLDFFSNKKNQENVLFNANETIRRSQQLRMMMPSSQEMIKITNDFRHSSIPQKHADLYPDPKFVKKPRPPSRGYTPSQYRSKPGLPRHFSHQQLNEYTQSKQSCRSEPEEKKSAPKNVKINAWAHHKKKSQQAAKLLPPMQPARIPENKENIFKANYILHMRKSGRIARPLREGA